MVSFKYKVWGGGSVVTLREVADKAGVSLSTASRVVNGYKNVNEETRKKVLDAIQNLNYVIYEAKRQAKSGIIATVIPKCIGNNMNTYNITYRVLCGITQRCNDEKIRNMLILIDENDFDFSTVYSENISAFIFVSSSNFEENTIIPLLCQGNVPVITVNRKPDFENISYVDVDDKAACYEAVKYLINSGHKKIGFVHGETETQNTNEKFEGYKLALKEANIPLDNSFVFSAEQKSAETGFLAANYFTKNKILPTAVIACSDMIARDLITGFEKCGLSVPDDISVMGFGDMEGTAYLSPSLTTVRIFSEEMGIEAADIAIKLINDKKRTSICSCMGYEIIKRESVKELNS